MMSKEEFDKKLDEIFPGSNASFNGATANVYAYYNNEGKTFGFNELIKISNLMEKMCYQIDHVEEMYFQIVMYCKFIPWYMEGSE